jgi:S-adenosylmethionine-diacylglycerol 3-amino-3-carboxypropyl transferase
VISYLETSPNNSIDRFSLSDVASYLDKEDYNRMIENICRTAKIGARFCIRQFSSKHKIPQKFEKNFKREPELEKQLESEDSSFFYRFNVGTIVK